MVPYKKRPQNFVDKSLKLNLGCGLDLKEGWINVDFIPKERIKKLLKERKIDIDLNKINYVEFDLNKFPYPFETNTIEEIYECGTFMLLDNLIKVMNELGRICKNGAKITTIDAAFPNFCSAQDPLVKTFITYNTFNYFEETPPIHI